MRHPVVFRAATSPLTLVVLTAMGLSSSLSSIAGDARWLPLMGRHALAVSPLGSDIPYAAAPTRPWPNVPLLAELVARAATVVGYDRGLLVLHVLAIGAGLTLLALQMGRALHGNLGWGAVLLCVVAVGATSVLLFVRLSLFSVALLPLELALLHREAHTPSRRVWLLVPLFALWSNLHGAALLGFLIAGAYLVLRRLRQEPATAVLVVCASAAALLLTPALWRTPGYYWGALHNEAARQHIGLWTRISLTQPLDIALVAAMVVCAVLVLRGRPQLWEVVALGGLAMLTASAARHGAWFLFVAAVPAARGLPSLPGGAGRTGRAPPIAAGVAVAAVALLVLGLVRGPMPSGAEATTIARVVRVAAGTPVLAEGQLSEQVAARDAKVWISNPLDAFTAAEQRRYVDWMQTGDVKLVPASVRVVLTLRQSAAAFGLRREPAFREIAGDARTGVFVRR